MRSAKVPKEIFAYREGRVDCSKSEISLEDVCSNVEGKVELKRSFLLKSASAACYERPSRHACAVNRENEHMPLRKNFVYPTCPGLVNLSVTDNSLNDESQNSAEERATIDFSVGDSSSSFRKNYSQQSTLLNRFSTKIMIMSNA